jgi:hypothetical protein
MGNKQCLALLEAMQDISKARNKTVPQVAINW